MALAIDGALPHDVMTQHYGGPRSSKYQVTIALSSAFYLSTAHGEGTEHHKPSSMIRQQFIITWHWTVLSSQHYWCRLEKEQETEKSYYSSRFYKSDKINRHVSYFLFLSIGNNIASIFNLTRTAFCSLHLDLDCDGELKPRLIKGSHLEPSSLRCLPSDSRGWA